MLVTCKIQGFSSFKSQEQSLDNWLPASNWDTVGMLLNPVNKLYDFENRGDKNSHEILNAVLCNKLFETVAIFVVKYSEFDVIWYSQ